MARAMWQTASGAIESFQKDIIGLMERTGYRDAPSHAILNVPADAATIQRMQALLTSCPDRFRQRMWESITAQIAAHRMTNRRAIRTLARLNAFSAIDDLRTTMARFLGEAVSEGYLRATFIMQKEAGTAWAVDGLTNARVQTIVDTIIREDDAKRFMDPMIKMSSDVVIDSMLRGLPPDTIHKSVDDVKGSMLFRSKRTARTTLTEASQDAHTESYKRHDIKMYRFVATWDEKTCPICGEMDGKEFPRDEAQRGVNYPPMHPNCRCTTKAVLDPEIEKLMDHGEYTDDATGITHEIPAGFGYKQWYNTYGPGRQDGLEYVPKYKRM